MRRSVFFYSIFLSVLVLGFSSNNVLSMKFLGCLNKCLSCMSCSSSTDVQEDTKEKKKYNKLNGSRKNGMRGNAQIKKYKKYKTSNKIGGKKFNFYKFKRKFKNMPTYKDIIDGKKVSKKVSKYKKFLSFKAFKKAYEECNSVLLDYYLSKDESWLSQDAPIVLHSSKIFFVEKIILDPKTKIVIIGDRHGDIRSLNAFFGEMIYKGYINKHLKITRKDLHFFFLGDYGDRGFNSCEVLYLLMVFKAANPDKVVLLKGNHEFVETNKIYGFNKEIQNKYGKPKDRIGISWMVKKFYNFLPLAVYVGTGGNKKNKEKDFALFCHAGIDLRFNPQKLLNDKRKHLFQRFGKLTFSFLGGKYKKILKKAYNYTLAPSSICDIGFVSNDFQVDTNSFFGLLSDKKTGRYVLGKDITIKALARSGVKVLFRSHQHHENYGNMIKKLVKHKGIYNLFTKNGKHPDGQKVIKIAECGPIWTLNVSPDSLYGYKYAYAFDTYAILTLKKKFCEWTLEPHTVDVLEPQV
ncbi:metallophosphoesterase [Candidatus Dependentiae bacterium]